MSEEIAHRTGYESPSWWYDIRGFFILKLAYRGSLLRQIRFFRTQLLRSHGGRHLEAAIGSGTLFSMVLKATGGHASRPVEIVGFDYADQMLAGALRRFGSRPDVLLMAADAHKLPFQDQYFETISIANAIHCFSKIETAMEEFFRVLKPGGTLATNVLLVPGGSSIQRKIADRINRWGMKKGILHSAYEANQFREIAKRAGFQIVGDDIQGNGLFLVLKRPVP